MRQRLDASIIQEVSCSESRELVSNTELGHQDAHHRRVLVLHRTAARCGARAPPSAPAYCRARDTLGLPLKLNETPIFQRMKEEGKGSKAPLTESFFHYPNNKYVLLALLGATAGQGVVWYTGQFYALFFLTITLKLNYVLAYLMIGISLVLGTPFFIFFGWLSDKIGRLKIILAGCAIAAVTYFPLFQGLTHYVNPALERYQ